jgi:hypothetical protein
MLVLHIVNAGALIGRMMDEGPQRGWMAVRREVEQRLSDMGGRDVVLVRYAPDHSIHQEWVYNGAQIDSQEVVWARDRGPERNRSLLEYFDDRGAWLLSADDHPVCLEPYALSAETDTSAALADSVSSP